MADNALPAVVLDQKRWSVTANQLKASIERARQVTLGLAVAGAILETAGAQIHESNAGLAEIFGYGGAAVLALAAVVKQWKLGHERTQAWILSRAASESLKHEIYLFCASAGPYASGNPAITLLDRRDEIQTKSQSFLKYRVENVGKAETPGLLSVNDYLDKRISGLNGQIQYFTIKAESCTTKQQRLSTTMFSLALVGALLGAGSTLTGRQAYGAWVAVITTVSGAIGSYALAQRYEQLAISFRATADRLTSTVLRWRAKGANSLAELVETCEAVLLEENQGWIAGADETASPLRRAAAASAETPPTAGDPT